MAGTVYECPDCGERLLERRCPDCQLFTRRLGAGGPCPSCEEPVLVAELLDQVQDQPAPSHTENLTSSRVAVNALALVCLTRAVRPDEITMTDLDAVGSRVDSSPLIAAVTRKHLHTEQHGLRMLCYQLGVI